MNLEQFGNTYNQPEYKDLIDECVKIMGCDCGRISNPGGKMFFIMGTFSNTKDDGNGYTNLINGEEKHFDYVKENVIASGYTSEELISSVKEYKRLTQLTTTQYLAEEFGIREEDLSHQKEIQ